MINEIFKILLLFSVLENWCIFYTYGTFSSHQPHCKCGYWLSLADSTGRATPLATLHASHARRLLSDINHRSLVLGSRVRKKVQYLPLLVPAEQNKCFSGRERSTVRKTVRAQRRKKREESPLQVQRFEESKSCHEGSGQSGKRVTGPGRTRRGRGNEAGERGFATPESGGEGLLTSACLELILSTLGSGNLPRKEGATNRIRERFIGGRKGMPLSSSRGRMDSGASLNTKVLVKPCNQWPNRPVLCLSSEALVMVGSGVV